jgi:hypothetical protein
MFIIIGLFKLFITFLIGYNIGYYTVKSLQK